MVYTDKIHMVADTLGELLAFGRAMGLRPECLKSWRSRQPYTHFLLSPEYLARAKKRGALVTGQRKTEAIALAMTTDDASEKLMADLEASADLPVLNGETGQTEITLNAYSLYSPDFN